VDARARARLYATFEDPLFSSRTKPTGFRALPKSIRPASSATSAKFERAKARACGLGLLKRVRAASLVRHLHAADVHIDRAAAAARSIACREAFSDARCLSERCAWPQSRRPSLRPGPSFACHIAHEP
jgi:hypothetical protein